MKQHLILFLIIGIIIPTSNHAQKTWSLVDCIQYARTNNIQLQRTGIAIRQAELDKRAAKMARLPSANGEVNTGLNVGRTIDPTTNGFINQRIGYTSFNVQASAIVYNGNRISNRIKQGELAIQIAAAEAAAYQQNLTLEITAAYLDILLTKEQVQIAKKQLNQTKEQLVFVDKRIKAKIIPASDRLEIIALIARNTQALINTQNQLEIRYMTLKNFLELGPEDWMEVASPSTAYLPNTVEAFQFAQIYEQALQKQPAIKVNQLKKKSAELGVPLAKADRLPTVALVAAMRSNYSNISNFSDVPFFSQFGNNFGQSLAVRVTIPIYNNHRVQINEERAKLAMLDAGIVEQMIQQQLEADIQNAITNAKGAKAALVATQSALETAQNAFQNTTKKYQLGVINILDYTNSKTTVDTRELDVLKAKYDYLFRLRIIDFYKGNRIQ